VGADPFASDSPAAYQADQPREETVLGAHASALGSPNRFQVWLRHGLLRPAWAALCGALASGGLTLSTEPLLRLGLLILLVDVIWGGLWSGWVMTDWATPLRQWRSWRSGSPVRLLSSASPDAPAGRLARTCGQLRSWWAELGQPALGPTLAGLMMLLPLALVGGGVLGVRPLLVTLAAIILLQSVFVRTGGDGRPVVGPRALFEITLPWLAGHALFATPSLSSTLLALAYGLSYAGALRMAQDRPGLTRWNLGQGAALIVLVALRQPAAATVAGLFFVGQALFQPGLFDAETDEVMPDAADRFLRIAQPWLMAAMLAAAWGAGLLNCPARECQQV